MLILPECCPDESIYSLVAKIARINGINHLEVTGHLFGENCPTSIIGCPVNIKHFSEMTRGLYGSPIEMLRNLTVIPTLAHLGEIESSTLGEIELGALKPELARMIFGTECHLQFCEECAARDAEWYGVAYWHRSHQLPTSMCCPEHGATLIRCNLGRRRLHDRLFLPYEVRNVLDVQDMSVPIEHGNLLAGVALLASDALADLSEPESSDVIRDTFKAGLNRMDLLTRQGKFYLTEYVNTFWMEFNEDNSMLALMRRANVSSPKQLLFGITDNHESRLFSRLVLIYWLFGTWSAFKEQCRWKSVLDDSIKDKLEIKNDLLAEATLQVHRQTCLDYKVSRINPTRSGFQRESYRVFRWLQRNDSRWLDEELPLLPKGKKQGDLFD